MRLPTGARLGPYHVLGLLGAGGMGEVYKARDIRLDRTIAIKVLSLEFAADRARRERFEREARAVAALNHPNICGLHDVGEAPDPESPGSDAASIPFLVMDTSRARRSPTAWSEVHCRFTTCCATRSRSPAPSITRTGRASSTGISSLAT